MKPEDLTPEELDRLACESVGIEPIGWGYDQEFGGRREWLVIDGMDLDDCEKAARRGQEVTGNKARMLWLAVSQEPAACAMLKAAISASGWRMRVDLFPAAEDPAHRWRCSVGATADLWDSSACFAETEERATALAVVSWKQSDK